MFERAITKAPVAYDHAGGLRRLDWPELVARLSAAQEMRALLAAPRRGGSFASRSAVGLARGPSDEPSVNLDALVCGKWPEAMIADTADLAATATGNSDD